VLSAALKIFSRQPALGPDLVEEPETAAASASPPDSAPASASSREVKRIWFRNEGPAPSHFPTPRDDARALLRWVAEAGYAGEPVLAEDMERAYHLMCRAHARAAYPWQLVGEPLRQLTGGVKRYTRIRLEPGGPKRHRRRVYQIPSTV
jgi:hypothetical protein